jgi:16S rRNA (cytidine1402-2'-O)-methyltransferase
MTDPAPVDEMAPGLYVLGTPIGNLGDLSPRTLETLLAARVIAAEDTRLTNRLLGGSESASTFVSLTEHNVEQRAPRLVDSAKTAVVALVSDAGTPAVSDPGARLVRAAHDAGVAVRSVPGPSALSAALSISGMDGADAHFLGFLPRKRGERLQRLSSAAQAAKTLIVFESPNRLSSSLNDVSAALGDPIVVVCREMTKVYEEAVRGHALELAERFTGTRGECTIVVEVPDGFGVSASHAGVAQYLQEMRRAGAQRSKAAAEAARRFGIQRAAAYDLWEER